VSSSFDQSAIASGKISIESEFGLSDPLAQLDEEVDDNEDDHSSSQDTDAGPCDQAPAVSPIMMVSKKFTSVIRSSHKLTGLGKGRHRSAGSNV